MKIMRSFKPDVMTGIMGPSIALAGALRDGSRRWCSTTPSSPCRPTGSCTRWPTASARRTATRARSAAATCSYAGYHELAYLHPNRFNPDPAVLADFGVSPDEPYSIVRFVSWQAVHDRQERGLSAKQKRHLVEVLQRRGRVLISSEAPLTRGPRRPRCPGAGGADPPPDRPRAGSSSASRPRCRRRRRCWACLRCSSRRPDAATPTTRSGGTGSCGTSPRTSTTWRCRAIEELLARARVASSAGARQRLLDEKIDVTAWMVDYFETSFADAR